MTFPILGGNGAVADAQASSLRFNDDDSPSLSRTISSGSDITKFTYSFWVKRSSSLGSTQRIISNTTSSKQLYIRFTSSDTFEAFHTAGGTDSGSYVFYLQTTAKFRDVSAYYHILIKFDSTLSTEADRTKIYVNGNQITDLEDNTQPSQNEVAQFINTGQRQDIGTFNQSSEYFDGYLAEFHFLDSISLTPTDFGEFDSTSGIWKVKEYTGSYGTNGYKLNFSNSGSLGADSSGNGNNFTATNLASTDQTTDTPTNNFSTFNSLITKSGTLSEGNLKSTGDGSGPSDNSISTMGVNTGKWYAEFELTADGEISGTTNAGFGICDEQSDFFDVGNNFQTSTSNAIGLKDNSNMYRYGTENASWGSSFTENDILQIALDMDNGYVYFGKNGTFMNSGVPTSGSSGTGGISITNTDRKYFMFVGESYFYATPIWSSNFGNPSFSITSGNSDDNGYGNFEYAPPSGYLALCTQNLATELSPTIDDGSQYFNTVLYTGDGNSGGARNITGVGFQPDWTWIKERNSVTYHNLFDSNRGAGYVLHSNVSDAEGNYTSYFTSFDSDGFTLENNAGSLNGNGDTYVAWNWLASGSTASNTDGTNASTVSANQTAGFSIVSYTRNSDSVTTVGHGLGKTPKVLIEKDRDTSGTNWAFITTAIDGTDDYSFLNTTNTFGATTANAFTTTTFRSSMGANQGDIIAYVFAEIEGYSKFGKFSGNSSLDGPMIYTGFSTKWVMYKNITSATDWMILDDKRIHNASNAQLDYLEPNTSDAEGDMRLDFLSNGFKLREGSESGAKFNLTGETYIYMAFASNPFVSSSGVPVTAR
jgi:hypothetical protein